MSDNYHQHPWAAQGGGGGGGARQHHAVLRDPDLVQHPDGLPGCATHTKHLGGRARWMKIENPESATGHEQLVDQDGTAASEQRASAERLWR